MRFVVFLISFVGGYFTHKNGDDTATVLVGALVTFILLTVLMFLDELAE